MYENKFKMISRCYVILAGKMLCYIFVRIFFLILLQKKTKETILQQLNKMYLQVVSFVIGNSCGTEKCDRDKNYKIINCDGNYNICSQSNTVYFFKKNIKAEICQILKRVVSIRIISGVHRLPVMAMGSLVR